MISSVEQGPAITPANCQRDQAPVVAPQVCMSSLPVSGDPPVPNAVLEKSLTGYVGGWWSAYGLRRVIGSRTPFGNFVSSYQQQQERDGRDRSSGGPPDADPEVGRSVAWPCPAPYVWDEPPRGAHECGRQRRQSVVRHGVCVATNLVVLCMSHIALGEPSVCPSWYSRITETSGVQKEQIAHLEAQVRNVCTRRVDAPWSASRKMGRIAGQLGALQAVAEKEHLQLDKYSSLPARVPVVETERGGYGGPGGGGTGGEGGARANTNEHRPVVADRLALTDGVINWSPLDAPGGPFLTTEQLVPFLFPEVLLADRFGTRGWNDDAPRPRPTASVKEELATFARWSSIEKMQLVPLSLVLPGTQAQIRAVYKSEEAERMVLDERGINHQLLQIRSTSRTIPCGWQLTDLFLGPREGMRGCLDDLYQMYNQFGVPEEHGRYNPVGRAGSSSRTPTCRSGSTIPIAAGPRLRGGTRLTLCRCQRGKGRLVRGDCGRRRHWAASGDS